MASGLPARLGVPLILALGAVAIVGSPAQAAPGIKSTPKIASVTAELAQLARQDEILTERYNLAGLQSTAARTRADAAQATALRAEQTYERSRAQVRLAIIDQFRGDGIGSTAALLTSGSGQAYLDQLSALQLLSARRATVTSELQSEKNAADAAQVGAAALAADAAARRTALDVERTSVEAQQKKYRALLERLNAAQRRALLAAEAARTKKLTTTAQTAYAAVAPSEAAAKAVRYALAQVGKPYVFAAAGPGSFDCSGLTMRAWQAAGVSLPHYAAWQYQRGHHVARGQLEPGDLVFFYSPISHVAMYIGHGLIVEAPHTGADVHVIPLAQHRNYVGATRL